jgi:hypothetical protein
MSIAGVRFWRADKTRRSSYYPNMPSQPRSDWYLVEWMNSLGLIPADLIRETGWSKAKVSDLYNGAQPYKRDIVNELAKVLKIRPFELLMHPDDAMRMRRLRETAIRIAAEASSDEAEAPPTERATRTG